MTGTASSRGRSVLEFDIHRNQEWLRRRKLRLEQVRKQSNEIAKALRQKVLNHEKARLEEYDRLSEAKFLDWKAEKLDELETKLMYALEEFGEGYKLAEEEPDPEEMIEEKYKIDWARAQKRGEIAHQEELKRRKIVEENKMAPIERKKLVRRKEDLRSALVLSVPLKKQLLESLQKVPEQDHPEKSTSVKKKMINKESVPPDTKKKMSVSKGKKKAIPQKSCMCKRKRKPNQNSPLKGGETVWINLNDIQSSSAGGSGLKHSSSKSSRSNDKNEKPEGTVEFYDFSSRYYCKSFKEFPHLIERIDHESEVLNANDLATMENEMERLEVKKKVVADVISQERGMEALKREKINQDYNNLITKLEELNRKEKILKAQQRRPLSFLHMNDERLSERLKMKQRLMDSKFEGIYYEALSQIPRVDPPQPKVFNGRGGGGDYDDGKSTRLSFIPSGLKLNSPVTSEEDCVPPEVRKPQKTKRKRQLLIDIDRALREGRELRKSVSRNQETGGEEEQEGKGSSEEEEVEEIVSPRKDAEKKTRSQESQTEELKTEEGGVEAGGFGKNGDDSLPVSTSTSYKSPPSVIRSYRLRQFLEYLEGVSEGEGSNTRSGDAVVSKMDALLQDLYHNRKREERDKSSHTLEYYIEKLLNMSRECVADLSVSSENVSTPNITDVEESKVTTPVYYCTVSTKGEDLVRKSRLNRAEQLEETIRNWKRILEKDAEEKSEEVGDVVDSPCLHSRGCEVVTPEESAPVICSPKVDFKRYEEITKKCSERISELSNMLEKVRKDKEKLLSSTSGSSTSSSNKDEVEESEADVEEKEQARGSSQENSKNFLVEGFLNRYNFAKTGKESASVTAMADSQSCLDHEESFEAWPDIMNELLRRKIITSPFKWSEGDFSSEFTDNQTKPSSIETVIGNFRKEISKIKAFSFPDSFPQSNSSARSHSSDEKQVALCSPKRGVPSLATSEGRELFQEESSVESINHALTTLGLNWARSFLRKNEESKAMSSSSEGKSSENEAD